MSKIILTPEQLEYLTQAKICLNMVYSHITEFDHIVEQISALNPAIAKLVNSPSYIIHNQSMQVRMSIGDIWRYLNEIDKVIS